MDNITLARLLDETAALLEIDAADPFRIRSYRRAAESVEQQTTQLATLCSAAADPKALLAIPGIGKGMAANIRDLVATGSFALRDELLTRYKPTMLELLRLPGMGPKTVAMLHSALGIADIDALEEAAKRGDLLPLPRLGEKFTAKLLKGIEDHRKNSSRFRIDVAREHTERISTLIRAFPGIETITPAGSLRRGKDNVGDLDLLVTGPACEPEVVEAAVAHVATLPLIDKLLAKGQNKVSFTLRNNLQVDVRLLPRSSYGAALQYFTGSKHHNVALRQRAIKRGLTLSEYALIRLEDNVIVASATEAEIYNALGLDYIPPELRENNGELEAAEAHTLPTLVLRNDIRGDLHMHTTESDGADSIRAMAEAAIARGLEYIAITDHSKNLAMTNGMDDTRALAHARRVREVSAELQADIAEVNHAILAGKDLSTHDRLAPLFVIAKRATNLGAPGLASETWVGGTNVGAPVGVPNERSLLGGVTRLASETWVGGTNVGAPVGVPNERSLLGGVTRLASETWVRGAIASTRDRINPTLLPNFRILTGVEVDILLDGTLDLDDDTLAQLDIVIASVHSGFNQTPEEVTARVLRAAENPHVHILGHPTGRKVLKREPYKIDLAQLLPAAARLGVAVEHNAAPARADLSDLHLRQAKQLGCKLVVNTDAHSTDELDQIDHGIVQLRRAWLSAADLLNTLPVDQLLANLRRPA
jgi:DNA polymerase (family 10)